MLRGPMPLRVRRRVLRIEVRGPSDSLQHNSTYWAVVLGMKHTVLMCKVSSHNCMLQSMQASATEASTLDCALPQLHHTPCVLGQESHLDEPNTWPHSESVTQLCTGSWYACSGRNMRDDEWGVYASACFARTFE